MEKTIVFLVTSGSYSDYRIDAIFSTRKLADQFIKTKTNSPEDEDGDRSYYSDFNNIQEWTIDDLANARWRKTWSAGILLDTGEIKELSRSNGEEFTTNKQRGHIYQEAVAVPAYGHRLVTRTVSYVSAGHAEKLAIEARQNWLRKQ